MGASVAPAVSVSFEPQYHAADVVPHFDSLSQIHCGFANARPFRHQAQQSESLIAPTHLPKLVNATA